MTDCATARATLRNAELALMQQRETVAEMRRNLPTGPVVEDYVFDTPDGPRRLTELFTTPDRPLVLYHFMYGKAQTDPCPMCSMWTDGWAAIDHHVAQRVDFKMVSAASMPATLELAAERGGADSTGSARRRRRSSSTSEVRTRTATRRRS